MKEEKYISMDEWGMVSDPDIIDTDGVGPCIGIGVFDNNKTVGYLIHFSCIDHEEELLKEFIDAILSRSHTADLCILLTGACVMALKDESFAELREGKERERRYVENLMRTTFPGCTRILNWTPDDCSSKLVIDTETRRMEVSHNL